MYFTLDEILPVIIFSCTYVGMLCVSVYRPVFAKYTYWVYAETVSLLPCIWHNRYKTHSIAHELALVNTFGLGVSIHLFYCLTQYRLLRIFGGKYRHICVLLIGDVIVHFTPFLLLYTQLQHTSVTRSPIRVMLTGCFSGGCHATYVFWVNMFRHYNQNDVPQSYWDPRPYYNVTKLNVQLYMIKLTWCGVWFAHVFGAYLLLIQIIHTNNVIS